MLSLPPPSSRYPASTATERVGHHPRSLVVSAARAGGSGGAGVVCVSVRTRVRIMSREWERLVEIGSGILRVEGQEENANALKDMPVMYKYISVARAGPLKSEITKPGHRISIPIEDIDERKKGAYKLHLLLNMIETYDYKI